MTSRDQCNMNQELLSIDDYASFKGTLLDESLFYKTTLETCFTGFLRMRGLRASCKNLTSSPTVSVPATPASTPKRGSKSKKKEKNRGNSSSNPKSIEEPYLTQLPKAACEQYQKD